MDQQFLDELQAIANYKSATPPSMDRAMVVMAMQVAAITKSYERETGKPFNPMEIFNSGVVTTSS